MNKLQQKKCFKESLTLRKMIDNKLFYNELSGNYKQNEPKTNQDFFEAGTNEAFSPKKKMHTSLITHENLFVQHYPAELKENKTFWAIEFYCYNPYSEKMERLRYKVNKLRKKLESDTVARREIKKICVEINMKLKVGWSPFLNKSSFNLITMEKSIETFLTFKKNELRFESNHSYTSQLSMFRDWLGANGYLRIIPSEFSKSHAMKYLDYVLLQKKVSNRTYNNYRGFLRIYFNWMIERNYCNENPFAQIKPRRNEQKKREIIPIEERKKIVVYLKENNYSFFIFTLLEYACLMRPIEILRSEFQNYDLKNQVITLRPEQTKNGNGRNIIIPNNTIDELRNYFNSLCPSKYSKSDYVFSTKLQPGKKEITTRYTGGIWAQLRLSLNLPKEFQLYSLRDSSITELLMNNVPAISVQKHADHSSLEITQIYANHITPQMIEDIQENSPDFY